MGNEPKCGGNCLFTAITSPKDCAVLHHEVKEALKDLKELQVQFNSLDKKTAVLAMRVTIVSAVIGSAAALAVRLLIS